MVAYIDATGVGSGVAPGMNKKGCVAVSVKVAERATSKCELGEFYQFRDQLLWGVREWLRTDKSAMLPPDDDLIQELLTPTYDIYNGKIKVMPTHHTEGRVCMKDLLKRSPDKLMSLAQTFAGTGSQFDPIDLDEVFK
jgi:hypothetical protein